MIQYVVKIKDKSDVVILCQIVNPRDLNYSKAINGSWKGSFFIRYDDINATQANFQEFNRVDIYEQWDNIEYNIFEGVIQGYEAGFEGVEVMISDFSYLFERRILFDSAYSASAEPVNTTLENIIDLLNTKDDMGITLDLEDILTVNVNKEWNRGENFLKILKDLVGECIGEWQVKNRKLQFKAQIGTDRTVPQTLEYLDFRYDIFNPSENSILNAIVTVDSKDLANAVLGKSGNDYSTATDAASILKRGRIESTESFDTTALGGLPDQTANYLELNKDNAKFYKVTPNTTKLTFKDIDIGDLIPVFVNTGSDLLAFDEDFRVVKISNRTTDNSLELNVEFAKTAQYEKTVLDDIKDLKDKVNQLEIS
jgi:hypothetical protein